MVGDPREHDGESDAQFAKRLREAARNETQPVEGPAPASLPRSSSTPERIGPFKILSVLGEGGMGFVYLAQQEKPVRRRVALKVVKLGMDSRQILARFEAERQALAMMDHPNVARVFEAGATDTGQPYFVMEYVKGVPISDYCNTHRPSTVERLGFFTQVCEAIQHAHQKGIIHRNVKPSNVLVSVKEDKPVPKVIDFGVAKITDSDIAVTTRAGGREAGHSCCKL